MQETSDGVIFIAQHYNIKIEIPAELKAEEGIEMAINAYRKSLADRKVQNMIHLREKAEGMTAAEISVAREEARMEEKHEIAKKLVALGEDVAKISLVTGLSEEEIKALLG